MPLTHFHNVSFPLPMREGLRCRLRFRTEIAQTRNQSEQRHCAWFDPLWEFDLEPVIKNQEEFDRLVTFWRARKGASFRVRHPLDHEAVEVQIGTGNTVATTYQLLQAYTSGITGDTSTARRIVHLPVASSMTVTLNDAVTTAYTVDDTTGVVTFTSAPGSGVIIRWSGTYDLPMRFAAQEMPTDLAEIERFQATMTLIEDRGSPSVAQGVAEDTIPLTVVSRLPLEMAEGSIFGPVHRLLVLTGEDEIAERLDVAAGTRLTASLGYRNRPWSEIRRLIAFFWGRRGRYASFQVFDPSDHTMADPSVWGEGDGIADTFAIVKDYGDSEATESRRLYRPVSGIVPRLDGFAQTAGFTVNTTRGEVTFTPPPDAGVEVAGACEEFDTLARFDTDDLEITLHSIDVASIEGLDLIAVTDEPVAITYQAGQTGRQVAAALGCGVPAIAPPAPPPLGLEFGHSSGPGMSGMLFKIGNAPTPTFSFYNLLNRGTNVFTLGIVLSHAGEGILLDLGGVDSFSDIPGPYIPFLQARLTGQDATALVPALRGGSGGTLPVVHNDPCNPNTRYYSLETLLSSDCSATLNGKEGNVLVRTGGLVPGVTILLLTFSVVTARVYCSGSVYGTKLLTPNGLSQGWFEDYFINTESEGGCWLVTRLPSASWYVAPTINVYLREPLLGCQRANDFVSYTGGGQFTLYELILARHNFAGPPVLPSLLAQPSPAFAEAILQIHQTMLRYFLFRYQLGLTPTYAEEGVLGHWTMDPATMGSTTLNAPIGTWASHTGGVRFDDVSHGLTTFPPILRAMPKPTISLESDLRLFDGSSVLTGQVLTTPVGG